MLEYRSNENGPAEGGSSPGPGPQKGELTVDTARITHPVPVKLPNTRELRALDLAERCFEEIASSHRGGTYTVPASGGGSYTVPASGGGAYSVTYTARDESCECKDWEFGHACYHVLAVAVVRAKTGICCECGRRFRHRELYEVGDDHLTYFAGDQLCEACAIDAGVL